jgi:hypothetical protein
VFVWIRLPTLQTNTLHIAYINQNFEPIQYTCDIKNIQLQFETQNSKSFINLNDNPMPSKPIK